MNKIFITLFALLLSASVADATSISGRITRVIGLSGVSGAEVDLYSSAGVFLGSDVADGAGNYSFTGLATGGYYVRTRVADNLIDEWYVNAPVHLGEPVADGAILVSVPTFGAININIALSEGGGVTGRVRDASLQAVNNMTVEIYERLNGVPSGRLVGVTQTEVNGNYTFNGLRTAFYYVRTRDLNDLNLIDEWYNGAAAVLDPAPDGAVTITVNAPNTVNNVNFDLASGGQFSGTVSAIGGGPVTGMTMRVFTTLEELIDEVETAVDGSYRVSGLPAGDYFIRTASALSGNQYVDEWYDDVEVAFGNAAQDGAEEIGITISSDVTNIDFSLAGSVEVAGRITSIDGASNVRAVENCEVFLVTPSFVRTALTDVSGDYRFTVCQPEPITCAPVRPFSMAWSMSGTIINWHRVSLPTCRMGQRRSSLPPMSWGWISSWREVPR